MSLDWELIYSNLARDGKQAYQDHFLIESDSFFKLT